MACVLLVFGGLVTKSFQALMDVELGFEPAGAVAWQINPTRDFEELEQAVSYFEGVVASVSATPGVEAVGLTDALPLGRNRTWGIRILGKLYEDDGGEGIFPHIVDHRYTTAMGIALLEGRNFTADDTGESAQVALVNESGAREMFPEGNAIGQFFQMWAGDFEVVGIVADVKHESLDMGSTNEVYFPISQLWQYDALDMIVRSQLPAEVLVASVGEAIRAVDPQIPINDNWTLDSVVDASVSPRRFTLQLLGAFAGCALLLAGLGIYGVLSYSVTEQIPEIGIRMALGASAATVRRSVVGKTFVLALVGVALGTGVALLGTRLISSLLYGVAPHDPLTFVSMIGVLLFVAIISGLIPAIRASKTDSAGALRSAT